MEAPVINVGIMAEKAVSFFLQSEYVHTETGLFKWRTTCAFHGRNIVFNDCDLETTNFYRWNVSYTQQEFRERLHHKCGIDFGQVLYLVLLSRGTSGRIDLLTRSLLP